MQEGLTKRPMSIQDIFVLADYETPKKEAINFLVRKAIIKIGRLIN